MFTEQFISTLADAVAEQVIARMSEATAQQRLFTIEDAARYLGRTPKAVEHLISRGAIQVTKIDGKRQIDRAALDRIIEEHTYYEV